MNFFIITSGRRFSPTNCYDYWLYSNHYCCTTEAFSLAVKGSDSLTVPWGGFSAKQTTVTFTFFLNAWSPVHYVAILIRISIQTVSFLE